MIAYLPSRETDYMAFDAGSDCTGGTTAGWNEVYVNHDGSAYTEYYDDFDEILKEIQEERKAEIEFQKSLIRNEKAIPVFYPKPQLKRRMMACNRFD